MQVYPDQTNVTIDMINKYVKGMFQKCALKNVCIFENAHTNELILNTIKSCLFDAKDKTVRYFSFK